MLGTSTHDTKRGVDARARLAILSEIPDDWAQHVQTWSRLLRARRADVEGTAPPGRNDEYLFYQLLVGTWPTELLADNLDPTGIASYTERLQGAMVKSLREAKVHSTWAAPDPVYEAAVLSFVAEALDPARAGNFFASLLPFIRRIAELGARNTLMQTVLKLTLPGMPDIYQGCELWDLSLVDPDNRRPIDYSARMRALEEAALALAQDRRGAMERFIADWQNGYFKLAVLATLLAYRRDHSALFETGGYEPLIADGPNSDQFLGFLRHNDRGEFMLTTVARFPARLDGKGIAAEDRMPLPEVLHRICWHDIVSGARHRPTSCLRAGELFALMPAAVLVPE
jgi:(1->4)-alpha-D-glucan 1-alpha-D-glucosylmutase